MTNSSVSALPLPTRGTEAFVIVAVKRDASGARYVCQARAGGVAPAVSADVTGAADFSASATVTALALHTVQGAADFSATATVTAAPSL